MLDVDRPQKVVSEREHSKNPMTVTFSVLREVINGLSCDFCHVGDKHKKYYSQSVCNFV